MKIENLDSELELKKEQDIESEQSVAVAAQPAAEEPTELPEKISEKEGGSGNQVLQYPDPFCGHGNRCADRADRQAPRG